MKRLDDRTRAIETFRSHLVSCIEILRAPLCVSFKTASDTAFARSGVLRARSRKHRRQLDPYYLHFFSDTLLFQIDLSSQNLLPFHTVLSSIKLQKYTHFHHIYSKQSPCHQRP